MNRRPAVLAAVSLCALAAACHGRSPAAPSATSSLQRDVSSVTRAAAAHDWMVAQTALTKLRSDLAAATAAGTINRQRAQRMRTDIAAVAADVRARISATKHAPTTATTPKPTPEPRDHHGDHGNDNDGDSGGD